MTYNGEKIDENNKIESLPTTVNVNGYNVEIDKDGKATAYGDVNNKTNIEINLTLGKITGGSIEINVQAKESGEIIEGTYKYYLGDELKETKEENKYNYINLDELTEYTLKVEVKDKEGNEKEKSIKARTIEMPKTVQEGKEQDIPFKKRTELKDNNEKEVPIPGNFKIAEDSATDVGEGVVIEDTREGVTKGSQFVWIPVISEGEYVRNIDYPKGEYITNITDDTEYLPTDLKAKAIGGKTEGDIEKETVKNAGGFYISRFEAGIENENTLISKKDAKIWNNITQENCKVEAKKFISNSDVKSALISGIQWDMVMKFIDKKPDGNNVPYNVLEYRRIDILEIIARQE